MFPEWITIPTKIPRCSSPRYFRTDPLLLPSTPNIFRLFPPPLSLQPRNLLGTPLNPYHCSSSETNSGLGKEMQCDATWRRKENFPEKGKKREEEKKEVSSFDLKPTESSSHKEIRYIVLEERRNDEGQRPISNYIPPLARR